MNATYKIEFIRPAMVEGRWYQPFSIQNPISCTLRTHNGKERIFRSMATAVRFATECFGENYKETLRIYSTR